MLNTSKRFISLVIIFALLLCSFTLNVQADNMDLNCKSAILIDASTGTIIVEKNAHESLPPASVTKVMTMLLIMEAIDSNKISLEDKVTISKEAASKKIEGTKLLLEAGEVRTVKDLLYGIAVESANDGCIAMGEHISGSEEQFVELMNKRAKELGMNDTTFKNPHGLHVDGHVTSAYDIGIMSRELIKHEKIFDFISKYMITVNVGKKNDVKRELVNKNKMVHFYKDIDGIKTGFTNEAMYCISLTSKRSDLRLISVIMGASTIDIRSKEARKLLDYGFANYKNINIAKAGETIREVNINKGDQMKINAVTASDCTILAPKGQDNGTLEKIVNLPKTLSAPISKGQKIGELILYRNGTEAGKYALYSDRDVIKSTFINNIRKSFLYLFSY